MNVFLKHFIALCLVFPGLSLQSAHAQNCTAEDKDYAKNWDGYYSPQGAYDFGVEIQRLVQAKDLDGIFRLIDGELENGPRRKFASTRSFDDIFPKEWVSAILSDTPDCAPVGWRGFMLGRGLLWFNKIEDRWRILSINGAVAEKLPERPLGWHVNGQLLHPSCFVRPWMSGDNFDEFMEQFSISDKNKFFHAPGKFLGREINTFTPITPKWCNAADCDKISLVRTVDACTPAPFAYENQNGSILVKNTDDGMSVQQAYTVLAQLPPQKCAELAPYLDTPCRKGYLISVGSYSGGSMGWDISYGIYGLFDLKDLGPSVIPLRYFSSLNYALNYLDP